jgi:hypothetical protein
MPSRYGPVVRLAPTEVSFISDAWHDIYGKHSGQAQLKKDPLSLKGPESGARYVFCLGFWRLFFASVLTLVSGLLYEQHDHIYKKIK